MKILFLTAALTLPALAVNAQEAQEKLLDGAEAIMFSSCLQNKSRSIEECSCYVKGVKQEMPAPDYNFFMEALYFSSNRDKEAFDRVMEKYDKTLETLDAMSKDVANIGNKIALKCRPDDKFSLPKPQ